MKESTGEGICQDFAKKAQEKCDTAKEGSHYKEDYCALGEALADKVEETDDEEKEQDDDGENKVVEDLDADKAEGDSAMTDDDLDDDLDEELAEEDKKEAGADGAGAEKTSKKKKSADRDGDGVPDDQDAFADDASESKDTDGDGIGDNVDKDIDGDGRDNEVDVFPQDKNEWQDTDHDGIGDNADADSDGDHIPNDKDKFPTDPTEWKDSDGDGVGDNRDAYPYNPNCHSPTEPCDNVEEHGAPKPGSPEDPATLDMDAMRPLPAQGYNEAMQGAPVNHNNYYTWVSDWQDEWPMMAESEKQTMARICKKHSTNVWCHRFRNTDAHFR